MSVSIKNQVKFYDWQLHEMDLSWAKYHKSDILDLYAGNTLFIGKIWGIDKKRGVLILRFRKGKFPRLKIPLTLSYPKAVVGSIKNWTFSYGDFRELYVEQYTTCTPIFYLENEPSEDFRYVGVKNVSLAFLNHINLDLKNKVHPIIVLGEEDPPRDYLVALREFTKNSKSNSILSLSFCSMKSWAPTQLNDEDTLIQDTVEILEKKRMTIIQGPPGTGKTFLISKICDHYLRQNKRICITALTHKALMEVAIKEGLINHIKLRVFKTNLSGDESAIVPELQNHDICNQVPRNSLLLATYYSLSKLLLSLKRINDLFDLIIIEEASQAFLTTIAGFSSLAKKVLVVGDFMQLQPIVLNSSKALSIDRNINTIINGLKTISTNNNDNSYRLVNSYRLTASSARLTGIFYNNSLKSKSKQKDGIVLKNKYSNLFCRKGGTSILYYNKMDEGKSPLNAILFIVELVINIRKEYPGCEIALLSPYRNTINSIIDKMLSLNVNFKNIEVNTVDRIQGLTVDICIFLAPTYKTKFAMDENRFNVATSRAKKGTLIILEDIKSNRILLSKSVLSYLETAIEIQSL